MANTLTGGFGLRPIGKTGGNPNNNATTMYEIANNYTTAIYNGGIVIPLAGGTIAISDQAVAPLGVLGGVEYVDSVTGKNTHLNYWPGSNNVSVDTNFPVKALVADNPNQLFKVASDATLTDRATALTAIFANATLGTSARTGSTSTGRANGALSVSSIATTATLPLRIVGIMDDEANSDYTAAGIPLIVRLNAHFNAPTSRFDSQTTATSTGL